MNFRKFIKTVPMKFYLILTAIVIFTFFSNDFGLVDIQKTAIILAAGIDKAENGFSLTAQVAVPKGSDRTTGGTSSVEIEAEGETISDCMSNIQAKTGWVPKLVFCNLLVLGEDAAKDDVIAYLNYFMRNEYMPDSCLLAVCEGKAQELISSQSAIDDASSLAIEKLFSESAVKSGTVLKNTLKDFSISHYGVSNSGYLPYVRAIKQEGAQNQSGGSSSGGGGGGSGQSEEKIYTAQETALFAGGKMVGLLSAEQTLVYSLLKSNIFAGTFNSEENGEATTLTILKDEGDISLEMKNAPKVKLTLDVLVRLCCRATGAAMEDVASEEVPPEVLEHAKEILRGYAEELWDTCKSCGCDLFELKQTLYRSSLKKYREWKDSILDLATVEIETNVRSMK